MTDDDLYDELVRRLDRIGDKLARQELSNGRDTLYYMQLSTEYDKVDAALAELERQMARR